MLNLSIRSKPRDSALGQSLCKAVHVSKRGDPSTSTPLGGKRHTMVMMFVGGVVSILPVENLWGGSVLFPPESIVVKLLIVIGYTF